MSDMQANYAYALLETIDRQQRLITSLEAALDRVRLDLDEVRAERDVLAGEVLP